MSKSKNKKNADKKQAQQATDDSRLYRQEEIAAMLGDWAMLYTSALHLGLAAMMEFGEKGDGNWQAMVTKLIYPAESWKAKTAAALLDDGALGLSILMGGALTTKHPAN